MKLLCNITDKDIIGDDRLSEAAPRYTARAILIDQDGYIAVMYSVKYSLYSLPGGEIKEGEEKTEALKRELLEETGCNCEIIDELGYVYENRAHSDFTQYSYYYIAIVSGSKGQPHMTENERSNGTVSEWHSLDETIQLISGPKHEVLQRKFMQRKDMAAFHELMLLLNS
ncbi:MAG: ADP-ribose pyrophosphatase [Herbinix sp.]|jgi:8-oxo-dGTP diphosphatase|nr:ADP-ribose pyrophosphatase [Herbinix sp.]